MSALSCELLKFVAEIDHLTLISFLALALTPLLFFNCLRRPGHLPQPSQLQQNPLAVYKTLALVNIQAVASLLSLLGTAK